MNYKDFLETPSIKEFISQAQTAKEAIATARSQKGINIFTLISDLYLRENFHSDIIKEFLDPKGSHGENHLYLNEFIAVLNELDNHILVGNYKNCEVTREIHHRIDILIASSEPGLDGKWHCIIIENKINDAVDMYKQIPRYVKQMNNEGYVVDAVVYIPKNPYKSPDKKDWTEEEKSKIKVSLLCGYKNNSINLVDNWIIPCIEKSQNKNAQSILSQYASLIKSLVPQQMENNTLKEFVNYIIRNNHITDIIELKNMIDEIPTILAQRLIEAINANTEFKHLLTKGPYQWKEQPYSCILEFSSGNVTYQIYIYPYISTTEAYAVNIRYVDKSTKVIGWIINNPKLEKYSIIRKNDNSGYYCSFGFEEQEKVVGAILDIIKASKEEISMDYENGVEI